MSTYTAITSSFVESFKTSDPTQLAKLLRRSYTPECLESGFRMFVNRQEGRHAKIQKRVDELTTQVETKKAEEAAAIKAGDTSRSVPQGIVVTEADEEEEESDSDDDMEMVDAPGNEDEEDESEEEDDDENAILDPLVQQLEDTLAEQAKEISVDNFVAEIRENIALLAENDDKESEYRRNLRAFRDPPAPQFFSAGGVDMRLFNPILHANEKRKGPLRFHTIFNDGDRSFETFKEQKLEVPRMPEVRVMMHSFVFTPHNQLVPCVMMEYDTTHDRYLPKFGTHLAIFQNSTLHTKITDDWQKMYGAISVNAHMYPLIRQSWMMGRKNRKTGALRYQIFTASPNEYIISDGYDAASTKQYGYGERRVYTAVEYFADNTESI